MTYNVFGGTLNLAQLQLRRFNLMNVIDQEHRIQITACKTAK